MHLLPPHSTSLCMGSWGVAYVSFTRKNGAVGFGLLRVKVKTTALCWVVKENFRFLFLIKGQC